MRILLCLVVLLAACNDKLPRDYLLDAAPTGSCGGLQPPCAADEYCDYSLHDCGAYSYGTCKPKPTSCDASGPPVCTCFGPVYPSACEAEKDGKLLTKGRCDVPTGKFQCGYELCDLATQYCQTTATVGAAAVFVCVNAPSTCTNGVHCDCLTAEPCGAVCDEASSPGTLLHCTK